MCARYSPKLSQLKGTPAAKVGSLMSSMRENIATSFFAPPGRTGASESEQLPITTVVTPCSSEGVASRSQQICGS